MSLSKDEILNSLKDRNEELEELGVDRIGLFGSFSRESQVEDSDIDFLVEFQDGKKSYSNYMSLKRFLKDLFDREVDLATKQSLKPSLRSRIMEDIEYAEKA